MFLECQQQTDSKRTNGQRPSICDSATVVWTGIMQKLLFPLQPWPLSQEKKCLRLSHDHGKSINLLQALFTEMMNFVVHRLHPQSSPHPARRKTKNAWRGNAQATSGGSKHRASSSHIQENQNPGKGEKGAKTSFWGQTPGKKISRDDSHPSTPTPKCEQMSQMHNSQLECPD